MTAQTEELHKQSAITRHPPMAAPDLAKVAPSAHLINRSRKSPEISVKSSKARVMRYVSMVLVAVPLLCARLLLSSIIWAFLNP